MTSGARNIAPGLIQLPIMNVSRRVAIVILGSVAMWAGGCTALPRNPVPRTMAHDVSVPGIPGVRFWGDAQTPEMLAWAEDLSTNEAASLLRSGQTRPETVSYLALSGGAADGAFGAGLLCGWTASGTRPEFKIVTGVSTGALIAPFAFVGPEYDYVLREVYGGLRTSDLAEQNNFISALLGESLFDTTKLKAMVARHVTPEFLEKVALGYRQGRGLMVCTTNLDAQRPVIWALGALAASGHPDSLQIFRDVMVASASVPGLMPPYLAKVRATDGKTYDELHVDGGASSQVFLYPAAYSVRKYMEAHNDLRPRFVYVIRNSRVESDFSPTPRRTLPIAGKSVGLLIRNQGVGDLYRIYLGCVRDQLNFRCAFIPETFTLTADDFFDPVYMKSLFATAEQAATSGYIWADAPPGFAASTTPPTIAEPGPRPR